jgi:membrane protein required for beta-lactamase induction
MDKRAMTDRHRRTEEELARERIDNLVRELTRKRLTSILLAVMFVILCVFALAFQLSMLAFCCLMIVLIAVIRFWDATGHVEDVRRRPTKFLHAPMSVLKPKQETSATIHPGTQA